MSSFIIPTEKTKLNACRENFAFQQETLNLENSKWKENNQLKIDS